MGQASRLSMTGKPAPDPDPGMPVPPAISSLKRLDCFGLRPRNDTFLQSLSPTKRGVHRELLP